MTEIWVIVWDAVQIGIGFHLIFPFLLYMVSLFISGKPIRHEETLAADYAIIVTAFRYTNNLPAAINSLLNLNYSRYQIYVVADACNPGELDLDDPRVTILYPEQVLASNIGSHFYAIDRFIREHDRLAVIDSDNLVHPEFLNELNRVFDQGFQAVQGLRLPKNLETTLACLDAARDIYYHFYDGRILFNLGSSATLSGSAMAFTVALYKECLGEAVIDGAGFDKILQAEIVKRDLRIGFAENAKVYDAKTSGRDELVNQRSRWIGTWFRFFKFGFDLIGNGVLNFSGNQILFGLVLLRPPLFIFLLLSALCLVINGLLWSWVFWLWTGGFILFVIGFSVALRQSATDRRIYRALVDIPVFMWLQVMALFRYFLKRRTPVSTKHS